MIGHQPRNSVYWRLLTSSLLRVSKLSVEILTAPLHIGTHHVGFSAQFPARKRPRNLTPTPPAEIITYIVRGELIYVMAGVSLCNETVHYIPQTIFYVIANPTNYTQKSGCPSVIF